MGSGQHGCLFLQGQQESRCYELNVCVSLKKFYIKITTPNVLVKRWDLWEVIKSWGWLKLVPLQKGPQRAVFYPVKIQQSGSCLQTRKRILTRTWPCWYSDLGLPVSKTMRNKVLLCITCSNYGTLLQRRKWRWYLSPEERPRLPLRTFTWLSGTYTR
jgi:hypothetical protein